MGRLRLYSRSTGGCQYDSAGYGTDSEPDERTKTAAQGGLLFYYNPVDHELWCHVDVTRDMPERFLARYDGEPDEDLFSAFTNTVETEIAAAGWSIPDRTGSKHEAFRSLPPSPPANPPKDTVKEINEIAGKSDPPNPLVFGAPDYEPAISLVSYFRNDDEGRKILVSTNGSVAGFNPDVRIDLRPYLDSPEPIESTVNWLKEHRFERTVSRAKSCVTNLRKRYINEDIDLSQISEVLRQHALSDTDAVVYTSTELRTRKQRARRRSFVGVLALGILVTLTTIGFLLQQRLIAALLTPLTIPIPVQSIAGYSFGSVFPKTIAAAVPLLGGLVALALGGLWLRHILGSLSTSDEGVSSPEVTDSERVDLVEKTKDTKQASNVSTFDGVEIREIARELGSALTDVQAADRIDDPEDFRDHVRNILSTDSQYGAFDFTVLAPNELGRQTKRKIVEGSLAAALVTAAVGGAFWLLVTSFIRYQTLVISTSWYAGLIVLISAAAVQTGVTLAALRRRGTRSTTEERSTSIDVDDTEDEGETVSVATNSLSSTDKSERLGSRQSFLRRHRTLIVVVLGVTVVLGLGVAIFFL